MSPVTAFDGCEVELVVLPTGLNLDPVYTFN